jgi:hypothetical protein
MLSVMRFLNYSCCKLPDDMTVLKHVAVSITQRDCCDMYCYGINHVFVGCHKMLPAAVGAVTVMVLTCTWPLFKYHFTP